MWLQNATLPTGLVLCFFEMFTETRAENLYPLVTKSWKIVCKTQSNLDRSTYQNFLMGFFHVFSHAFKTIFVYSHVFEF